MEKPIFSKQFLAPISMAALALVVIAATARLTAAAQNPQLQERLAELKQSAAQNKQALAHYTWQEQQTVSVKGEVKKQDLYQVHMGPDGKPQKVDLTMQQPPEESGGRLKRRIIEKKKEEFQGYAEQVAALVHDYVPPDPERMQQAFQQGSAVLGEGGGPGGIRVVFTNYVKPGDSMTLVFNREQGGIQSVDVRSYLDNPSDGVTFSARFATLPDGTSHMSNATVNGESKHLTIQMQNTNYQRIE